MTSDKECSYVHGKTISNSGTVDVSTLQNKYQLFDGTLGTVKGVTAKLKLKEGAEPQFFKACHAPYALKDKIEQEIHRLEGLGILEKVEYSD